MTLFDVIANPLFKHKFVLQKIVCHLTNWERDNLIVYYDEQISSDLFTQIEQLYNLYAIDHEPLEYILWYVEYGWLRFHVNKNTIIPRPETEYMIEAVKEYIWTDKYVLVDVGTWSWVLWLSILHSHGKFFDKAFLIDISEDALAVAKKNYDYCIEHNQIDKNIDVTLSQWNLFDLSVVSAGTQEVIILANLPYIPDETFDTNPDLSIKYEPRVAFVGGDDGLDLYRIMFQQIRESGYQFTMFLEMMTWQVDILRKEFDRLVFDEIKTFHFQIRIVKVTLNN